MSTIITKNRKAYFNYTILEKHLAGLVLLGSEVKSIRNNKVSISEAYCLITAGNEIFIKHMFIGENKQSGIYNHQPLRDRKLLLKKKEIIKLSQKLINGLTIVPLELILGNTGLIKLQIGLAKGKNTINKKAVIKDRDAKRELRKISI